MHLRPVLMPAAFLLAGAGAAGSCRSLRCGDGLALRPPPPGAGECDRMVHEGDLAGRRRAERGGARLRNPGRYDEADACFDRAAALDPGYLPFVISVSARGSGAVTAIAVSGG